MHIYFKIGLIVSAIATFIMLHTLDYFDLKHAKQKYLAVLMIYGTVALIWPVIVLYLLAVGLKILSRR